MKLMHLTVVEILHCYTDSHCSARVLWKTLSAWKENSIVTWIFFSCGLVMYPDTRHTHYLVPPPQ